MAEVDSTPAGRHCTKCGEFRELAYFGNAPKGKWGKSSRCKECDKAYVKENYARIRSYWNDRQRRVRAEARKSRLVYTVGFPESMKVCCRCRRLKDAGEFHACAGNRDGLQKQCRSCRAEVCKQSTSKNIERVRQHRRRRRQGNPAAASAERRRDYVNFRDRHGVSFVLRCRVSNGIRKSLKNGKEGRSAFNLLDFTLDELRAHLEKQFLPGMGWHNMAEWHIDHIVPLASFSINGPGDRDFKVAWALSNLRPLWQRDNKIKSDKRLYLI